MEKEWICAKRLRKKFDGLRHDKDSEQRLMNRIIALLQNNDIKQIPTEHKTERFDPEMGL